MMHKIQSNKAPTCLQKLLESAVNTKYNLRNNDKELLFCKPWTEHMKKRAFAYNDAKLWNDPPGSLKQMRNNYFILQTRAVIC